MANNMKILLVCGSIAKKSHTRALLMYLEVLLKAKRVETIFWDLLKKPLPIALPEYHKNPLDAPDFNVKEFVNYVTESNALVLGSPLYHGSFSGVLKNALDNLYYDAFCNKPVALVSNSSSIRNCAHPCEHLRLVVRTLYGYALQSQIGTSSEDYEEKETEFVLSNKDIQERCKRMIDELIELTTAIQSHDISKED
ncbi:NAD(P)H-dependent oxidoreductase [Candidatus Gottesmanbacteria bacterium]|nr:NAD(P)H-dependent oxidoreductase [Candidatus Gottesmanbacteria bacterium]